MYSCEELRKFSEEIKDKFENAEIRGPIHLSGNNEQNLIDIFKQINKDDWVFSTHRSHYHALLKGIDIDWLRKEILAGRSITVHNLEHKFITSAIVSGILPMALGTALAIKRKNESSMVWAFVGDMSSLGGTFHEVVQYARGHDLPLKIVIEDNGFSTNTPTYKVWGDFDSKDYNDIVACHYTYERIYPHQGCGKWVQF